MGGIRGKKALRENDLSIRVKQSFFFLSRYNVEEDDRYSSYPIDLRLPRVQRETLIFW